MVHRPAHGQRKESCLGARNLPRMAIERGTAHRRRALVLALSGGFLMLVALVGVPGHFNPEACTNDVLSGPPGVGGWESAKPSADFSIGYACKLGYADGSTEHVEHTARWPLVVGPIGVVLLIAAAASWLRSRVPRLSAP